MISRRIWIFLVRCPGRGEDGQADFVIEIAVRTSERRAQTLSRYGCHAEAKDEDDKEYGDGSESHMNVTPLRPLGRR